MWPRVPVKVNLRLNHLAKLIRGYSLDRHLNLHTRSTAPRVAGLRGGHNQSQFIDLALRDSDQDHFIEATGAFAEITLDVDSGRIEVPQ